MENWEAEAEHLKENPPKHLLFLCVANSARSQMAEGIARHLAPKSIRISSAGSNPGTLSRFAVRALAEIGIDISAHYSKGLADIDQQSVDAVITLCAEEVCPIFPRKVTKLHWGLPDPAGVSSSDEERLEAFRKVRDELVRRLTRVFGARGPNL